VVIVPAKRHGQRNPTGKPASAADGDRPARPGRFRWPLRVAILLVAGLALLYWPIHQRSRDTLTIQNQSGQRIDELRLTAAGETKTFHDVAPGAEVAAPLKADDRFTVEGQLADGTMIRGQFGGTAGDRAPLVILPGGQLVFRQQGKSP
jgi:hypothetical protein